MKINFRYASLAGLAVLATFGPVLAQQPALDQATQQCLSIPTQDCLLAEVMVRARANSTGGILGVSAVGLMADVARVLAKMGRKEQADRAFAEADTRAKIVHGPDGSDTQNLVVRALFNAGRIDEAMQRAKTVKGAGIAEAAIDALIAAGRLSEAESFLASVQSWNINIERKKLAEAYIGAGLTDKALSLITLIGEPLRTSVLTDAAYKAETAGHTQVVATLMASLPDDPARQAMRQKIQQYSSSAALTTAFSSALEKGNFEEASDIVGRPELASTRPEFFSRAMAAACKAGKRDLARKLDSDMLAALAAVKPTPIYLIFLMRRGETETKCHEDQLATATFADARKYIDTQPKQMHPYLDGLLAQGYVSAGNIQAAIETARLTNDLSVIRQLVTAMAKAGYGRKALEYVDREASVYLPDMMIVVAENMPVKVTPPRSHDKKS